jgi:hypothetical protein
MSRIGTSLLALAVAGTLVVSGSAFAVDKTKPSPAQAAKKTDCEAQAKAKKLIGAERQAFKKTCMQ